MLVKELIAILQDFHPTARCSFQYYEGLNGWEVEFTRRNIQENRGDHSVTFAIDTRGTI